MNLQFEVISDEQIDCCKELCNELMAYQKSKTKVMPELFDFTNFETRFVPSVQKALYNHTIVVKDDDLVVGYVYSNISPKEVYDYEFATFFDFSTVKGNWVVVYPNFISKKSIEIPGWDPSFSTGP